MGNLFGSLATVAESMKVFEKAMSVTSNNVTNANTPGYAKQGLLLIADRLEIDHGLPGGVDSGGLISARQSYLEQGVRRQLERFGYFSQQKTSLEQVEPVFEIGPGLGIAGSLDAFQNAVSQWTVSPNDLPARQSVLRRAQDLAQSFHFTAGSLGGIASGADNQMNAVLTAVNRIGAQLQGFNRELRSDVRKQSDPGLDAQIHSALEELAELTNFTMLRGDDGTFTVFVGGQTPMVIGDSFYPLSVEFGSGQAVVRDAAGSDITAQIGNGRLRALLDFRSGFLPGVMAELNQLAEAIADQVNAVLVGGVDMFGLPPAVDLFTYDASRGSAATLAVTAILPEQLAAAQPQAPGGNGNALALARLFGTRAIQNFTFSQFFGETAGGAGRALSVARDSELTQGQLLAQAKAIRGEASAVSLDEEAAQLVAFQRAYQASAQLVRVLNEMTEEAIGLLR